MPEEELAMLEWLKSADADEIRAVMKEVEADIFRSDFDNE